MKKVLAMVLAVFMLVSVLCVGVSADADESAFAFVADSVTAFAGQTVDVTIRTQNNPGIVGLQVTLGYDESVLTPVAMVEQDFTNTTSFGPLSNPLNAIWYNAISPNNTTNGVIAKITFQVAADAPVGEYPLTVGLVDPESIFNSDFEVVPVITIDGAVNVVSYTPGDVNNDGKVNVRDLGLLQQSLNGWDVEIVKAAADVNGDDKLNVRDLGVLQQYLNGWDVELLPGGSSLGGGSQPEDPDQPGEGGGDEPVDPPVDPPVEPSENVLSIADAIAIGSSMAHNTYTEEKYYVTGVITEVYNTVYGNMKIADDAGNILTIYGTFDADGTNRYDAMEVKPVAGDTVTIYGIVGQYSDAPQIKNGWIVEHIPGEGGDEPVDPPVEPVDGDVIDFTDKANRVSYSTEQQVWAQNGITVTNDKGASTSNVGDYGGDGYPARFYKSSTVTIEAAGMTQLIIDCNGLESKYVNGWVDSITDANATGSVNGTQVIIVFTKPVDSFTWETLAAQSRANSITVVGEGGGDIGGGDDPVDPGEGDDPVEPSSSAVIDFTNKDNRTFYSTEQQVWEQNGIVVTNDKGASTSNVGDYGGEGYPARFYKSSTVTIEYPGMTQLVIDCSNLDAKYVNGWSDSITDANATGSVDGSIVTIVFAKAVDSFTWETLTAQSRAYSITVYSGEAGGDIGGGDVGGGDVGGGDVVEPDADELTIADAIALGSSMDHNTYTEQKYYVTGTITEVYNSQYGNMYITDGEGNTLTIYGTFGADGELRYDALEVKPVAGDIVTIYGIVGQYNGTAQIKNGWIVDHVKGEGVEPAPELSVEDAPVAGVAYKFGMVQGNVSADAVYYLTGAMSSYYMATTTSSTSAIDVYLEETAGGYYLYTMDEKGTKAYINMVVSGTHVNGQFGAATATTVYTFDTDSYTLIAEIDGAYYWFGTRSDKNYTTVGPCNVEYAGFYCQLYA